MASPLYGNHGQKWEALPQPAMGFAPENFNTLDMSAETPATIFDGNAPIIASVADTPAISH
jgi:hypothetical protein